MVTNLILAIDHSGKASIVCGPEVKFMDQRQRWRELSRENNFQDYEEIQRWDSLRGLHERKRFRKNAQPAQPAAAEPIPQPKKKKLAT